MLRSHGAFLPFGAQLLCDGEIVSIAADGDAGCSPPNRLIALLKAAFRAGADEGDVIATALVYDVRVVPPGESAKSDAIALNLDHYDAYSIRMFIPYAIVDGDPALRPAFMSGGDYAIFASPSPLHA